MSLPRVVEKALGRDRTRRREPFTLWLHPDTVAIIEKSEVAYVLSSRIIRDRRIEPGIVFTFGGSSTFTRHDLRG